MIVELKEKIEASLLSTGMINKVIHIIDESDAQKMINTADFPTASMFIDAKKIVGNGRITMDVSINIADLASEDIDDVYATKDKAMSVANYLVNNIDEFEYCEISATQGRSKDLSSVLVITTINTSVSL